MALINECQFRAASGGLGDFVVASAITGFFTPEQCTNPVVVDGETYHWRAESDDFSQHELFEGIYTSASDTVSRTTIFQSSNAGAKVNFAAAPRVRQVAIEQDLGTGSGRTLVTAAVIDYYVDGATGSDANDGSIGSPWETIQRAVNFVTKEISIAPTVLDLTINVAAGVYDEIVFCGVGDGIPGGLLGIHIKGADKDTTIIRPTTDPTNPNVFSAVAIKGPYVWSLSGIDIDGTQIFGGGGGAAIQAYTKPTLFLAPGGLGLRLGSGSGGSYVYLEELATCTLFPAIEVYGDAFQGFYGAANSFFINASDIIFVGNPTIAQLYGLLQQTFVLITGTLAGSYTTSEDARILNFSSVTDSSNTLDKTKIFVDEDSYFEGAQGVRTKAGAVVAADLAPGTSQIIRDTSGGTTALYYNNAGTLMSVALT